MTNQHFDFEADYGKNFEASASQTTFGYDQLFTLALTYLREHAPSDAEALVIGPGPGREFEQFAAHEPNWKITGVDPSDQMIELARQRVAALELNERVELVKGYLDDLPDEPRFHAAIAVRVMHFLDDDGQKLRFLENLHRRLHPGGAFAVFDVCGDPQSQEFEYGKRAWKRFMDYRGKPATETESITDAAVNELHIISEERLLELLREAGFKPTACFYNAFAYRGWIAVKV